MEIYKTWGVASSVKKFPNHPLPNKAVATFPTSLRAFQLLIKAYYKLYPLWVKVNTSSFLMSVSLTLFSPLPLHFSSPNTTFLPLSPLFSSSLPLLAVWMVSALLFSVSPYKDALHTPSVSTQTHARLDPSHRVFPFQPASRGKGVPIHLRASPWHAWVLKLKTHSPKREVGCMHLKCLRHSLENEHHPSKALCISTEARRWECSTSAVSAVSCRKVEWGMIKRVWKMISAQCTNL